MCVVKRIEKQTENVVYVFSFTRCARLGVTVYMPFWRANEFTVKSVDLADLDDMQETKPCGLCRP